MNRIVIIGNGKGAIATKKKDIIENSTVIRLNNFKLKGYEEYIGTKTDIYSCSEKYLDYIDTSEEVRRKYCEERGLKGITKEQFGNISDEEFNKMKEEYFRVHTFPKIESLKIKEIWFLFYTDRSKIEKYSFKEKIRVADETYDKVYSNGFRTILHALKHYPEHEIFITGFDNFMSSGWYWDGYLNLADQYRVTDNFTDGHPYLVERDKMKKLITEKRIVEI